MNGAPMLSGGLKIMKLNAITLAILLVVAVASCAASGAR